MDSFIGEKASRVFDKRSPKKCLHFKHEKIQVTELQVA